MTAHYAEQAALGALLAWNAIDRQPATDLTIEVARERIAALNALRAAAEALAAAHAALEVEP